MSVPTREDRLARAAAAVADSAPFDWSSAESSAADEAERALLERLRVIEEIARLHSSLPDPETSRSGRSASNGTPRRSSASTAHTPPANEPASWGPLRILEKVGEGRFGEVYRAWDPRLEREVALKLLRRRGSGRAAEESLVVEEARLMARVRHPNVATIYGAEQIAGRTGLWMELVDGRTLEQELAARGPFPAEEIARVGIALCEALAAVHRAGLVHRDLKAQNVMREAGGRVVLGDFGTGRELDEGDRAGTGLAGTPVYVAPEIFGHAPATPRSDLYSLGVLLFYLATGSYPVTGGTVREIGQAHARGDRRSIRDARPDLPAALARAIERALSTAPEERFEDADAMARALRESLPLLPWHRRVGRRAAAAMAVAAVALLAAGIWFGSLSRSRPIAFEARDWILLTAFENRTGEAILDGTLELALERELSASRFVNVVPRERAEDALRLMRKPPETRLDASLGRQVALRDGGIRALVTGTIEKLGDRYVVTARILRPSDGAVVATISEASVGHASLLPAVREASLKLRETLGEALQSIDGSRTTLASVTTTSLQALELYSQAAALIRPGAGRSEWAAVEQLLREAVRHDPDFASAHILLAQAASNLGQPLTEVLQHARRAVAAADGATEVERFFVSGRYHSLAAVGAVDPATRSDHLQQAVASYLAALRLQPDHHRALDALAGTLRFMDVHHPAAADPIEAKRILGRLAEGRPHNVSIQVHAAMAAVRAGDLDEARRLGWRARDVAAAAPDGAVTADLALARLFPALDAWLRDDVRGALRETDAVTAELETLPGQRWASGGVVPIADMYLTLGRIDQAEAIVRRFASGDVRTIMLATVTAERGDPDALRRALAEPTARSAGFRCEGCGSGFLFEAALRLVDAGLLEAARALVRRLEAFDPSAARGVSGQLAVAEGRLDEGIARLQAATTARPRGYIGLSNARRLADAWQMRGDTKRAIEVLERATAPPRPGVSPGWEWIRMRARLAELYRAEGRMREAVAIEAELHQLLAVADADHPLLLRLASGGR